MSLSARRKVGSKKPPIVYREREMRTDLTSLQDSLTGEEFNFSPGQGLAMVNKNNYTLTYSGHGSISSHQEYQHHQTPHSEYCCCPSDDTAVQWSSGASQLTSLFTLIKFLPEDICW